MKSKPVTRPVINKQLLEALDHFATPMLDPNDHLFVTRDANGYQTGWSVQEACRMAGDVLAKEELSYLKLLHMQTQMKKFGLHDMYEQLMGEKLV